MADKKKGSSFWPWMRGFGRKPKVSGSTKGQDGGVPPTQEKPGLELKLGDEQPNKDVVIKALTIVFGVLNGLIAIVAIALIAVATLSAIVASGMDTHDASGRLVSLIILVFTSAVAIAVVVYALLAIFKHKTRGIFVAAIVLTVLALLQLIVAGAAVRVTEKDQVHITQGLAETFQLVKQHSPRHVRMWASMQNSLHCCGIYSPYDYRASNSPAYLPPDVPISCCPTYDPNRSELVQEKEREYCKARNEYFTTGCSGPVLEVITDSSHWAFNVAVVLLTLELLSATFGGVVVYLQKKMKAPNPDPKNDPEAK